VHARVANGDLHARATIASGDLLPLAVSMNLMLERLARSLAAESALGGLEYEVQQLTRAVGDLARGRLRHPVVLPGSSPLARLAQQVEALRQGIVQLIQVVQSQARQITTTADNVQQGLAYLAQQNASSELADILHELTQAEQTIHALSRAIEQHLARLQV
jgi:methyl-accepting chemotaxis protein